MNPITRERIISELVCIFMSNRIDPAEIPELVKEATKSYDLIRPVPACMKKIGGGPAFQLGRARGLVDRLSFHSMI